MARDSFDESKTKKKKTTKAATKPKSQSSSVSKPKATKVTSSVNKTASKSTFLGGGASTQKVKKTVTNNKPKTVKKQPTQQERINQKTYGTTTAPTRRTKTATTNTQRNVETKVRQTVEQARRTRAEAQQQKLTGGVDAARARKQTREIGNEIRRSVTDSLSDENRAFAQRQKSGILTEEDKKKVEQRDQRRAQIAKNTGAVAWKAAQDTVSGYGQSLADVDEMVKSNKNWTKAKAQKMGIDLNDKAKVSKVEQERQQSIKEAREFRQELFNKQEKRQAEWDERTKNAKGLEKAWYGAVESGTGMLADTAVGAVTGTGQFGALASMGLRTYGPSTMQARKEGATDKEARLYGAAQSAKEMGTELMFQGAGLAKAAYGKTGLPLAEKAANALTKGLTGIKADAVGAGVRALGGTAEENIEEFVGWGADPIIKELTYGKNVRNRMKETLRANIPQIGSQADAANVASYFSTSKFTDDLTKDYVKSGMSKDEASKLAAEMRDYYVAYYSGDQGKVDALEEDLAAKLSGQDKLSLKSWSREELGDTLASTTLLTLATGMPGAVKTSTRGNQIFDSKEIKDLFGTDAVNKVADMVRNSSDKEVSLRAETMKDRLDSGKDLTGTQKYDLWQGYMKKRQDTAKKAAASEGVENKAREEQNLVRTKGFDANGNRVYAKETQREYNEKFASTELTVEAIKNYMESDNSISDDEIRRADAVKRAVSDLHVGGLTVGDAHEFAYGSDLARETLKAEEGIDLDKYIVRKADGTVDLAATNEATENALFEINAANAIKAAQAETEVYIDDTRGNIDKDLLTRFGNSGQAAWKEVNKDLDPRDLKNYLTTANAASYFYSAGRNTDMSVDEAINRYADTFKTVDNSVLEKAFAAGAEDRIIANTPGYGQTVEAGSNIQLKKTEPIITGQLIMDDDVVLPDSDQSAYLALAMSTNTNIHIVSDLNAMGKDGKPIINQATGLPVQLNGMSHGNDIYLNMNEASEKNLGYVFMHEMTHQIKQYAPNEYLALENLVRDKWFNKDATGMQAAIKQRMDLYSTKGGQQLTEEEAVEEIIADAMAEAMDDPNFAAEVCDQDINLGQQILDSIRAALRSIRQIFANSDVKNDRFHNSLLSYLGILDEAEKMWIDALHTARQNKADGLIADWQDKANKQNAPRLSVPDYTQEEMDAHRQTLVDEVSEYYDSPYTDNYAEAGFVFPNGQMLRMGMGGQRADDHRIASHAYDDISDREEALNSFINEGNIRWMPEMSTMEFGTAAEPTAEQYEWIRNVARNYSALNGMIRGIREIDFTDADGETIESKLVNNKSADAIINDIKRFYKTGTTEGGSQLSQFRFSLSEEDMTSLNEDGVDLTESGSAVRYSLESWQDTDIEALKEKLRKAGFDDKRIDKWIKDVNSIAALITGDMARLNYTADQFQDALKPNAEYFYTLDLSTLCQKRRLYQGTYNKIMRYLVNNVLLPEDTVRLRAMMDEMGYQVPCGICYEESRKKNEGKFAERWLNGYGKKWKGYKNQEHTDPYIPTLYEVTTTEGREKLREEHPEAYESYVKYQKTRGSANPKISYTHTDYRGDILRMTDGDIQKVKHIGGLRIQSFSDFEIPHVIDMMQAVMDMSAQKLTAQAYTKVPAFAKIFGGTGIKINLSLIGRYNPETDQLEFDAKEGIDPEEAFKLRDKYSKNVGTILVGSDDVSILKAWADPRVDMVIPFHRSGWSKKEFEKLGLIGYKDYTKGQTERYMMGKKDMALSTASKALGLAKEEKLEPIYSADYWDENLSGKENAERYLALCAEKHYRPVFYQFLHDNGDGTWSLQEDGSTDGYWKSLIDFKMYDNEGNFAPQELVQPTFGMDEAEKIMSEYEGGADTLPVADDVVEAFLKEYKENHPKAKFSLSSDSLGRDLSADQSIFFRDTKALSEDGSLLTLYHGTSSAGFTTFKPGLIWLTTSRRDADSYGGNWEHKIYDPEEREQRVPAFGGSYRLDNPFFENFRFDTEEDMNDFIATHPDIDRIKSDDELFDLLEEGKIDEDDYDRLNRLADKYEADYRRYELNRFGNFTWGDLMDNPERFTKDDFFRALLVWDKEISAEDIEDVEIEDLLATMQEEEDLHQAEGMTMRDMMFRTRIPEGETGEYVYPVNHRSYEVYANLMNPLIVDLHGDGIEGNYGYVDDMLAGGYDGLILRNCRVGRYHDIGDVAIAKESSQVKLTSNENPSENPDVRYSLNSDGEELTKGQADYFANSQARDEQGRLVKVYHTTNYGGFTIFDPSYSDDKRSLFFAEDWDTSQTYGNYANSRFYYFDIDNIDDVKKYLDAYSPDRYFVTQEQFEQAGGWEADMLDFENVTNGEQSDFANYLDNPDGYIAIIGVPDYSPDNTSYADTWVMAKSPDELVRELHNHFGWQRENYRMGTQHGYYACYLNLEDPYIIDAHGDNWNEIHLDDYDDDVTFNTREIAEMAMDMDFDGVIIRNLVDHGGMSPYDGMFDYSDIYIAFSSNQVKDVNNENPTENPDIRYSVSDEDEAMSHMAHDYAYDTSYEALAYYEDLIAADASTETTYEKAKNYIAKDVDEFYAGLTRYADGMKFDDPVLEEGRTRMARSKQDYFNSNVAKWNDAWLTDGEVLDPKSIKKPVRDLVMAVMSESNTNKKYKTDLVNKAIIDIRLAYFYAKKGRTDVADALLWHSAHRMIDGVEFYADDTSYEEYKGLRDYMKNTRIQLGAEYWSDVDFGAFRKENFGRMNLVKGETNVDKIYAELEDMYPGLFDSEEYDNAPDQLMHMASVLDSVQPYAEAYSSEYCAEWATDIASDLLDIMQNGKELQSIADRYTNKYEARIKAMKARHAEAMLKVRQQRDEGINAQKAKFKEYKEQQKEKRAHNKSFESIQKTHKKLTERLLTNTADKNIPEQYKRDLARLLAAFDLQTVGSKKYEMRTGRQGQKTIKMAALKTALTNIENKSHEFHVSDAITDIIDELLGKNAGSGYSRSIEGLTIDELSTSELDRIDKLLKALLHEFNTYRNVKIGAKRQQTEDIGKAQVDSALEHAKMFGAGKDYQNIPGGIDRIINLDEVTPAYMFKHIDPEKSGLGLMFKELRRSFDKYVKNQEQLNEWMNDIVGKYHKKSKLPWRKYGTGELENWRSENYSRTFNLENGTVRLTPAQMMSLYCLSKRTQAYNHMTGAGIVVAPVSFNAKIMSDLKKKPNTALPVKLTDADIKQIVTQLTPEQIKVAEDLQQLMAERMAAWGNEASMNVLGIELFGEPDYFPIKSDKAALEKDLNENEFVEAIRNFGFTKAVQPGARNAIMVDDIFDVVTEHCNNMNLYNAYSEAINDFMKVYNYRDFRDDGSEYTVQQAIAHAYGSKATTFIMTFMRDLNGNVSGRASGIENLYNSMLGNAKKAAVFANLRVAAQQPTAITRAFAVIDPKYLKGIKIENGAMDELFEHCPIALWKSWGYYDINMGKSIEDIMMNNGRWLEDAATELYGALDNVTWTAIWQMVKAEMKDTHPDVKVGSDEYWELCNERMTEVVDLTQVVDSPFHRSHAMRDKGIFVKAATSFMAEPTLTFNMLRDGVIRSREAWKKGDKAEAAKIAARIGAVALLQAATVAGAASLVDALRKKRPDKDDEDERFLHLWWVNALENFRDELKVWNKIYFVKDIASIFDGWDNSNLALQGIQKFALGYRQLTGDPYARSSAEWYENMIDGIGYMTGVPVKTVRTGLKNAMGMLGVSVSALDSVGEKLDSVSLKKEDGETGMIGKLLGLVLSDDEDSLLDKYAEKKGYKKIEKGNEDTGTEKTSEGGETEEPEKREQLDYDTMLNKALKAAEGYEGEEYNQRIYSSVAQGMKGYIADGDYVSIGMMRTVIEQAGGDVSYFDQRVMEETKTAYKKTLKYDQSYEERNNMKAMYRYMMQHGMSQEELSSDVLYKSDLAKDMKVAYRIGDNNLIYEAMLPLVDAGITETDLERLYENRNRMDLTKYKQNGRFKDKLKSMGTFIWPTDGVITSHFGYRNAPTAGASSNHPAIDIGAPQGTAVVAADGGVIIYAGTNSGYGNSVGIKHDNGMVTYYNHLYSYNVNVGDTVAQGQQIAKVGSTGISTGPHLDFKILDKNGKPVDPEKYLN